MRARGRSVNASGAAGRAVTTCSMTSRWRIGIAVLLVVGIVPAAGRTVDAIGRLAHPDPTRPGLARSDQYFARVFARARGAPDGSAAAAAIHDDFDIFLGKFGRHPWATLA